MTDTTTPVRKNPLFQRVDLVAKLRGAAGAEASAPAVVSTAEVATRDLLKPAVDESTVLLHVDQIEPDPNQPRDDWDNEEMQSYLAELAADIKENGQLDPIVVEPLGHDRYRILAGECRWRAIKDFNNDATIRATIRALGQDDAHRDLIQLNSNEQRRNFTKLQLAHAYRKIQERYGWSDAELARQLSKSRQYVSAVKKVLAAPPEVQAALNDGRVSWREWVRNDDEVMRDFKAGAFREASEESGAPVRAAAKPGKRSDAALEPNVSIPQSIANQIFLHMQDVIEDKGLNIEVPKNPTRRQLGEFITKHFRKIRRAAS